MIPAPLNARPSPLRRLVTSARTWVTLPIAVHVGVFLGSSRVWTDVVTTYSRSGAASEMSVAHQRLILLSALTALYLGSGWIVPILGWSARGMREVTEAERGCAAALLRGAALTGLYWSAWSLLRAYVV